MNTDFDLIAAVFQRKSVTSRVAPRSAPVRLRAHLRSTRLLRALQRWWQRLWMDERTAYLSEATSHVDLEYRIRAWDDKQRHLRLPFV